MVCQVKMFLTWTVPRPGTPNTMYGATAGPASAAGSGPAGRHARVFQVPCEAGEDEAGEDEAGEDVTGRPPAGRPVPGRLTMAPTPIAATAMVAVVAVVALRIPRRRARLRRTRMSGMGRRATGRTQSASCSCSESSNITHFLVGVREVAV
jgi:hypothetical protein